MTADNPAHVICDSIAECQAIIDDTKGGKHTKETAYDKIVSELGREGLLRAMHQVGYLPPDTPPPGTLGH